MDRGKSASFFHSFGNTPETREALKIQVSFGARIGAVIFSMLTERPTIPSDPDGALCKAVITRSSVIGETLNRARMSGFGSELSILVRKGSENGLALAEMEA